MARPKRKPKTGPNEGWILKQSTKGKKSSWKVDNPIGYSLNAIDMCKFITERLAKHHVESYLNNKHPDGSSMASGKRKLREASKRINPDRQGEWFNKSGERAEMFYLDKIEGSSLHAKRKLKIFVKHGEGWIIDKWLKKGIDLMATEGAAADVISQAINDYMQMVMGSTVQTQDKPNRSPKNYKDLGSID